MSVPYLPRYAAVSVKGMSRRPGSREDVSRVFVPHPPSKPWSWAGPGVSGEVIAELYLFKMLGRCFDEVAPVVCTALTADDFGQAVFQNVNIIAEKDTAPVLSDRESD